GIGGDFGVQIGATDGNGAALASEAIDAVMKIVDIRGTVALADAALECPIVGSVADQVSARAEMPTIGIVVFITAARGERKIVTQPPFILEEERPGFLFEGLAGNAIDNFTIPVLGTNNGNMGLANGGGELGIEDQVGGFQLAVIAADD